MMTEYEPFMVEPGWVWCDIIRRALQPGFRLLYYMDGTVRFEHRCHDPLRGDKVCAPALRVGPHAPGHVLTRNEDADHFNPRGKPTVTPSVDCPDCDLHGFITDGWWRG